MTSPFYPRTLSISQIVSAFSEMIKIRHNHCSPRSECRLPTGLRALVVRCMITYVSVNFNWVHLPGNPRGLALKTCPEGRDLTFESCPWAGNSTRNGILWKMKVKLQKNSVDQFLQVKTKNKLDFFTFFEVYVFSQWNFSWSMDQFFGSAITHTLQKI